MKTWYKNLKVRRLREKLLKAKEDQMHHRLIAQHYDSIIHDIDEKLGTLSSYHSELNLINVDFERKTRPENRIITAG